MATSYFVRETGSGIIGNVVSSNPGQHTETTGAGGLYSERRGHLQMPSHLHRTSLHFTVKGEQIFRLGDREIALDTGKFLIVNYGTAYTCHGRDDASRSAGLRIELSQALIREVYNTLLKQHPEFGEAMGKDGLPIFIERCVEIDGCMAMALQKVRESMAAGKNISENIYVGIAERLIIMNHEVYRHADVLPHALRFARIDIYKRLNLAKEHIDMNYHTNLSLEELSKVACLSKHHFKRLFKKVYQYSPHQYLTMVRINHALKLLRTSSLPVNEVSGSIGFQNTSSFIRLFRNTTGLTPTHYRATAA